MKKTVVFRTHILPYSETFIASQFNEMPVERRLLFGINPCTGDSPRPNTILGKRSGLSLRLGITTREVNRIVGGAHCVLAHFAQDGWRISRAAYELGVPLYVYCHGSDVLTNFSSLRRRGPSFAAMIRNWPTLVSRTTKFIAASKFIEDRLKYLGVPEERVQLNYIGVPIPDESEAISGRPQPLSPALLFVGRLVENKGIDDLLAAFVKFVRPRLPSANLTVVGDGPLAPILKAKYASPSITFLGAKSYSDTRTLLRKQHLVVAPSREIRDGSSEGLNQVVLEAQSYGLPVIANRVGGLPEALADRNMLVEPRDLESLGLKCVDVLTSASYWDMSAVGSRVAFVRENFNVERQTARLLNIMDVK